MKKYQRDNAAQIAKRLRAHRDDLGESYKAADREYGRRKYRRHREKYSAQNKEKYRLNAEKIRLRVAAYARRKRQSDPEGWKAKINARARRRRQNIKQRVNDRMSNRLWRVLKRKGGKRHSWIKYVDYSVDQLVIRLNETMPPGYDWTDFMAGDLHIDHIRPVAAFAFRSAQDAAFRECWALLNLQLLPAAMNLKKNAKLDWPAQLSA